jgi:hypothetical protein
MIKSPAGYAQEIVRRYDNGKIAGYCLDWTPEQESADLFATEQSAERVIKRHNLKNAYIVDSNFLI